ncbi:putative ubiquitin carboxyl-terminal hydrolase creB [Neolecta irregularis DAH-3]|uniref:ubiquitinyl hydrolase 1 n=1 Tax=Neolecta irregularis (strain DAH-3) TaxID=1198029 RepID=A0A1U7LII1_NEOID|nr:putative ubiquitin carboxyl-terminal hydrolase creB [Neolecta irregularis DAH-3]|eukprot:OLL22457.1 putative ubiquitin carboxyl-terminal hydrolase creB [Neolecta irregularis DAH-3]
MLKLMLEMFAGPGHQDAHELFISLLDGVMNDIDNHEKTRQDPEPKSISESFASESITMLKDIFSGLMTNETRCLTCENITYRDEAFRDLSLDVDEYPSINERLQNLSETEFLCGKNKFLCDECGGLQEAEKRTKIKKFPKVLVLHLKRFKYCETDQSTSKLFNRMEFDLSFDSSSVLRESKTWQHTPTDVGIATTLDMQDKGIYELFSIVVHLGNSLIQGHYVSITKTDKGWMVFDDDRVEIMQEPFVEKFFGEDLNYGAAYLLFYQEKGVTKIATNGINRSRQTSSVSTSSLHGMSINRTPSSSKVTTATDEPTETFASEQVLTFEVPEQPPREKTSRFKKLRPHASSLSRKFRRKKDQDIVKVEG